MVRRQPETNALAALLLSKRVDRIPLHVDPPNTSNSVPTYINIDFHKIVNGSFSAFIGWVAIGAGTTLLTIASGGTVLIAYATVGAGVTAVAFAASEVTEGIGGWNPGQELLGEDLYNAVGLLANMSSVAGPIYASSYLQMYRSDDVTPAVDGTKSSQGAIEGSQAITISYWLSTRHGHIHTLADTEKCAGR